MIRLLVTGRHGQVAMALAERAQAHPGIEVMALGRPEFDLEQPLTVETAILAARPGIVVNAAAYTAVDKAEAEPDTAFAVNRDGAAAAAQAAAKLGVPFIHLSTDYVYPGTKQAPYVESDATGPLGIYGRSKLEGEIAVAAANPQAIILRTAWIFSPFGANFVKTMLRIGRDRDVVKVVDDQHGNPTSALDIAGAILRNTPGLIEHESEGGIYHCCGTGSTTWCGFARAIFVESAARGGPAPQVEAITTAQYPTPATRPQNSRLDTSAFAARFGFTLRPWPEAMAETVGRLIG